MLNSKLTFEKWENISLRLNSEILRVGLINAIIKEKLLNLN